MDNELLLFDRMAMIRDTITKYGEEKFYIAFSGGKDSVVLHRLVDLALPGNRIPRLFINTGVEYIDIVKYVKERAKQDDRIVVLNSGVNIRKMLETYGYPFKSKGHAKKVSEYKSGGASISAVSRYLDGSRGRYNCPKILRYQFTPENTLKISHRCCDFLKKRPAAKWGKQNDKSIGITGMKREEGGARSEIKGCAIFKNGELKKFHPLLPVPNGWEDWFIERERERLCRLYYEPFNFERTGCKGCPFALNLQEQLETMEKYLPNERKQCESLWKPVYDEYRRIGYRLKKDEQLKLL